MPAWRIALMLLAGVAYAGASHWMMVYHAAEPWAVVVLLAPLWLTGMGLAGQHLGRAGLALVAVLGLAGLALIMSGHAGDPNPLYVLQHVGINALLAGWFGGTLRGGQISLIGQFAQRIHALTPDIRHYTARVTAVWTVYFCVVCVLSLAVYLLRPFEDWSLFSNVITPVGVGALFVGEYLLRYRLHPEFERVRLIDAVRAFYAPAKQ